jgi:hypothetical protein
MAPVCSPGPMGVVCIATKVIGSAVGGAVGSAASSVLSSIAQDMANAAGSLVKTLATFWMSVHTPQLDGSGTPVSLIEADTGWIVTSVAVVCILVAAGQMAVRRRGQPFTAMTIGLARLVVVSGGATFMVEAAGKLSDAFSAQLIGSAHLGGSGLSSVISVTAMTSAIAPGSAALMLIIALLVIFSSLIQLMLMILRVGLLVILTGTLPLAASAAMSEWGESWWRRHIGWLVAWLLYKPTAALLYDGAFRLTQGKTSAVEVLAGLMLLILSVLMLPALLRVIVPATASLGAASGGPLAMAALGAAATGAIKVAGMAATGGASAPAAAGPKGGPGVSGPTGTQIAAGGGQAGGGSSMVARLQEIPGPSSSSAARGQAGGGLARGASRTQEGPGGPSHGGQASQACVAPASGSNGTEPGAAATGAFSGSSRGTASGAVDVGTPADGGDSAGSQAGATGATPGIPQGTASGAVDFGGGGSQMNGGPDHG